MDKGRQINERIRSIASKLDSDGVRHVIIAVGDGYMIIRSNNNIRSVTRARIASETFMKMLADDVLCDEVLSAIVEGLQQAERDMIAQRGRGV